jgi:hypothetical protein
MHPCRSNSSLSELKEESSEEEELVSADSFSLEEWMSLILSSAVILDRLVLELVLDIQLGVPSMQ